MILVSAAEMRELDRLTIERYGTPGYELMSRAGEGAAAMLLEQFPHVRGKRVVILAGKGNNGGDGLIVARLLKRARVKAEVVLLGRGREMKQDASTALADWLRAGGRVHEAEGDQAVAAIADRLAGAALIVDALFGTGLNAPITGVALELIELINASGVPVFAIDIPSGLHADRGIPLGAAIQAEATATFGFAKLGQVIYPGASFVGVLGVVDIGIAAGAIGEVAPKGRLLDRDLASSLVPRRAAETHKGTTGHVVVIAGSRGHSGAALMSAHAAVRMGAGLTTLAGPSSLNAIYSLGRPEVMTAELPDRDGKVGFDAETLRRLLSKASSVVVGPGLGTHEEGQRTVFEVIEHSTVPVVLDADALTGITSRLGLLPRAKAPVLLTPHPGEMARLIGESVSSVQADRVAVARKFAAQHGCVVILKGARTVIAAPDDTVWINTTGNPAMASGGMGDTLSGMLGGLLAQGLAAPEAACLAVFLHGEIADHLAANRGPIGILASDISEGIPAGVRRLLSGAASAELSDKPLKRSLQVRRKRR